MRWKTGTSLAFLLATLVAAPAAAQEPQPQKPDAAAEEEIHVPFRDLRGMENVRDEIIDMAIAISSEDGIALGLYLNSTKSPNDRGEQQDGYDPDDERLYHEVRAAAQDLIRRGYPVKGLVLASSTEGDSIRVHVDGRMPVVISDPKLSSVRDRTIRSTIEGWELIQSVDREIEAEEKRETSPDAQP